MIAVATPLSDPGAFWPALTLLVLAAALLAVRVAEPAEHRRARNDDRHLADADRERRAVRQALTDTTGGPR